jgi:uncharacterized protein (TIGR00645 family)
MESTFFDARFLLAPFFFCLMACVIVLLFKFYKEMYYLVINVFTNSSEQTIVSILTLIDVALLASLLLIIAFSGYENFVSKFNLDDHEDRPAWMGKVSFSDLKIKLIGAIVAISAVELLKSYINVDQYTSEQLAWKVGIHLTFVVSGVLFALTDYLSALKSK